MVPKHLDNLCSIPWCCWCRAGCAPLLILFKNCFTFWRAKKTKEIHLLHMPLHLQPQRKKKELKNKKKLCFYCSSCPLISLHFPCLCVCGNAHLWERARSSNVFCSCLVGPLLKPYGPPRAEKQGWKIQRDSLCKSSVVLLKSSGLPRQPEVISERKGL